MKVGYHTSQKKLNTVTSVVLTGAIRLFLNVLCVPDRLCRYADCDVECRWQLVSAIVYLTDYHSINTKFIHTFNQAKCFATSINNSIDDLITS